MRSPAIFFLAAFFILPLSSCDKATTPLQLIKADTAYNQGQFDKAIAIYEDVLKSHPEDAEIYWKLGISYYSKGDLENAKKQEARLRELGQNKLAEDLEHLLENPQ